MLNVLTGPFDFINYLGSCVGVHIYGHRRMAARLDRVLAALHRSIDAGTTADLARGMHYSARWDPFFNGTVSPVRPRARDLPAQHRDLMPQDQDLRVLGGVTACQKH